MKRRLTLPRLAIIALLVNTIYSMVWPVSTLYLHQEFHLSLTQTGMILMIYSFLNALGSYVAGQLFDRLNKYAVLMIGIIGTLIISLIGLILPGMLGYVIFLLPYGFLTGWALTVEYSMVSYMDAGGYSRRDFNLLYLAVNIGLVLGSGSIGYLYDGHGIQRLMMVIVIIATCVLAFALLVMPFKYPNKAATLNRQGSRHKSSGKTALIIWLVMASLLIMWLCYSQWMTNMSVYLAELHYRPTFYSHLWVINGIGITVIQLLLLRNPHIFKQALGQARTGLLFCLLSFVVIICSHQSAWIIAGMIFLTCGEALYVPAAPVVVDENTPYAQKGRNQGLVNVFSSVGKALGPFWGGLMIDHFGYQPLFIVVVVALIIAREILIIHGKRLAPSK
ncbi:MFS transporter [Limosilactobacillus sp.]|uniref:MFS transporter n=1 Tax=Limosilactobacillus sp. TaxID=2773925 RepID=UPI00345ED510